MDLLYHWGITDSDIAIPEISSDGAEEQEDEMRRVIKDTVAHVILHDKKELSDLLMELRGFSRGEPLLPLIE